MVLQTNKKTTWQLLTMKKNIPPNLKKDAVISENTTYN